MKTACLILLIFCASMVGVKVVAVEFKNEQILGKRVIVCRVNVRQEKIQQFLYDDAGKPFKSFGNLDVWLNQRGEKLLFAMNGGMFRTNFSPVGLFIRNGIQLAPLNTNDGVGNFFLKPNGVFLVSKSGAQIVEASRYPQANEAVMMAAQSGPLLVDNGKIHPAFNKNSENRKIRNGVGVPSHDVAIFVITQDPVNFFEFAVLFRDQLHCPDALYLDGVISGLHSPYLKRSDTKHAIGPIIAVTE